MNVKNKAFTLIEILIVIIIIGIIMVITLDFGGGKIIELQKKTTQETFLDELNNIQMKTLSSNYYEGKKIKYLSIEIQTGIKLNLIYYDKDEDKNKKVINNYFSIKDKDYNISLDDKYTIKYIPYNIGCNISTDGNNIDSLSFSMQYKKNKYCYKLLSETCKYQKIKCN